MPPASLWTTLLLCLTLVESQAAVRQWDAGAGTAFWGSAVNWTNNVAPVAGDDLYFPSGIQLPSITTNNYAAGTAFGKITISAADSSVQGQYILGGNRVTLNGGLAYSGVQLAAAPLVACDITLGADQAFTAARGMTIAGRVDLNNRFLTLAPASTGNFRIDGTITNSAGPYAYVTKTNAGTLLLWRTSRFQVARYWSTDPVRDWPSLDVQHGTVRLDGIATNGNIDYPVLVRISAWQGPATLVGTGIVDRVEVWGGGVVSPGNNGIGILRGGLFTASHTNATLVLEINGTNAGVQHDQLVTSGYPSWDGKYDLRFGYLPLLGDAFNLIATAEPIGNPFTPGDIIDHTNGCSFGSAIASDGLTLKTLRRPDSPFTVWRGAFGFSFPFFAISGSWLRTNNWSAGIGPTNINRLIFTEYGPGPIHPLVTNDLTAGSSVASLTFRGTNSPENAYTIHGNALTVTEGITNRTGAGTNTILMDLVAAGSLVFDVDTGSTLRFGRGFSGGGTVRKTGGGVLLYSGTTVNSFVGDFVLAAGTLRVDGVLTDGGVTVTGGTLCGTGTVASVSVTGGTLNPGSSPGILHVEGNLNLAAGATCRLELNSPIAGSGYDQLQVNGVVTLNGATLDIQPGYAVNVGSVFLLIVNDGNDPVVGTFAGLPQGAVFSAGGQTFSISYQSGSGGNDVVLTRVNPQPPPGNFTSITLINSGTLQFQGHGGSNVSYTIQMNTNVATTNWLNLGPLPTDALGQFTFNDTNIGSFPQRFYRLRWP